MIRFYLIEVSIIVLYCFTRKSCGVDILACRSVPDSWIVPDEEKEQKEQDNRLKALEENVSQLQKLLAEPKKLDAFTTVTGIPKDCGEIYNSGVQTDGIYTISPDGRCPFFVYCDMENGGWTVIQRRINGDVSFYRNWDAYVAGFGTLSGNHWLGLDKIHRLTKDGYQIHFDIENYDGSRDFAHYKSFTVHGVSTLYRMNVDAFGYNGSISELFSYHDNMAFSTYDRDNDKNSGNCCEKTLDGGAWWYNSCYRLGNPNGVYGKREPGGIGYWTTKNIPIKNIEIRIKARYDTC